MRELVIAGPMGAGKSTAALAIMDANHRRSGHDGSATGNDLPLTGVWMARTEGEARAAIRLLEEPCEAVGWFGPKYGQRFHTLVIDGWTQMPPEHRDEIYQNWLLGLVPDGQVIKLITTEER